MLLDEPSNHLDNEGREILYDYIRSSTETLVVVSHDRTLLNGLGMVYELSRTGLTAYGGNYDFYVAQKAVESHALSESLRDKEKALRKAREIEREAIERQQKLDARGKKKKEKEGLPTIFLNTLRNNAEKSTARMKGVHAEKTGGLSAEVNQLRKEMPNKDQMKMGLDDSALHKGKILVTGKDIPFGQTRLDFQIRSGERIALTGPNGSGKTTLIRMILGERAPASGTIERAEANIIYIDQDYSLIEPRTTVYEHAQRYNTGGLLEHEIKIRLTRFLFDRADWDKPGAALSGGEKMRLLLCCLTIGHRAPDMIVLDEPTNNLDIQNIAILTTAVNEYKGTLLAVSHDAYFLEEVGVERYIPQCG